MALTTTFKTIGVEDILGVAAERKAQGWRFVQILCTNTDDGIDVQYSYMKDDVLESLTVKGVQKGQPIPSITSEFIAAFVFENESHDLFGVNIEGIAIDFGGRFYDVAMAEPMTVISPEQKAAREKAAKIAAAKAAKAQQESAGADDLEAKLAGMDPEKAAKVRAAMEAKARKEAAAKQAAAADGLEEKLAGMDPEKAAKVRAAMEAKKAREAAQANAASEGAGE